MIDLQHFVRGGYRDTHRVVVISPNYQPPKIIPKRPKGWINLKLVGLIIYGAKNDCGKDNDAIVNSAHRRFSTQAPPFMSKPLNPKLSMWFTTDDGFVVDAFPCVYFNRRGHGDLILHEMGLAYNNLDECKGWEGELPVEGRKISHSLLLKKYVEEV